MKKFFLSTCLLLFSCLAAQADEVVLAADILCPVNCEPGSDKPGYIVEIARAILEPHGHTVKYQVLPFARAIEETRRGDIDGVLGALKYDTPDFVFPEHEQGMLDEVFFVKKDSTWTYDGIDSLRNHSLAVIHDYIYSDGLQAYIEQNIDNIDRIQTADGEEALATNIRKLVRGRVDIVVDTSSIFQYVVTELGMAERIKPAGVTGDESPLYLAFSPAKAHSANYAKLISEGMVKLRASGELAKILARYNLKDWRGE